MHMSAHIVALKVILYYSIMCMSAHLRTGHHTVIKYDATRD
jgi:hypothetical protein